jgi:hypothetical protein
MAAANAIHRAITRILFKVGWADDGLSSCATAGEYHKRV